MHQIIFDAGASNYKPVILINTACVY